MLPHWRAVSRVVMYVIFTKCVISHCYLVAISSSVNLSSFIIGFFDRMSKEDQNLQEVNPFRNLPEAFSHLS